MKIGILGYYPPPVGGISIHVKRLGELLEAKGIEHKTYSIGAKNFESEQLQLFTNRRKWAMKFLFSAKEDLLHCHIMGWTEKAFYVLVAKLFRKKIVFTFHSFRDTYETLTFHQKIAYKIVRHLGDAFIIVGKNDYNYLIKHGWNSTKTHYIPGFIAPIESLNPLPSHIETFITDHEVLLVGNASNNNHYKNEDLYGIDLCIDLMAEIKNQETGFLFFLSSVTDEAYFEELIQKIDTLGLTKSFIFIREGIDFYPVLKRSTLFLRPTNTDGDAISIRESLYFQTPVIASDVATRPEGVVLFKNRDLEDLIHKTLYLLNHQGEFRRLPKTEYGNEVIKLYQELLGKGKR